MKPNISIDKLPQGIMFQLPQMAYFNFMWKMHGILNLFINFRLCDRFSARDDAAATPFCTALNSTEIGFLSYLLLSLFLSATQ